MYFVYLYILYIIVIVILFLLVMMMMVVIVASISELFNRRSCVLGLTPSGFTCRRAIMSGSVPRHYDMSALCVRRLRAEALALSP